MKDNVTELAEKILIAMYHGASIHHSRGEKVCATIAWNAAKALYEIRESEPYEPRKPEAF